ncbi:hypothetical protein ACSBL2_22410 [Pedobacter sp. AW31-3R]|uniref:hypothetical protein n=1 Tax=Pedobacter sp. AW31-3R TaxID=3445781 RepID=UPI003F9F46BB
MKFLKLFFPILLLIVSCKKDKNLPVDEEVNNKSAYIVVNCVNCKIDYGMPDQYQGFSNANGDSPKFAFNYKAGYTLSMHLSSLVEQQKLTVKVYNKNEKLVYEGSNIQPVTDYWDVKILLPAE